ncbi:hypothetical protein [Streptomyces rubellomurinus]|uniref:Uncharacterized protein n=1 Tax=Streptomyces rubellomurinus (strain ATCC 31215) TaxID=359131 RepID=A0A0F2TBR3_STRR3|nr:hypothetical protein [Streptomyces rubellomurinus]KJS60594.1 hypothetical protein VM95_20090 [Streptomyces rubellomurinus]
MSAHHPIHPADPALFHLTGREIAELIVELRTEGREFGLLWPSAEPGEANLHGRRLVNLGNIPASTLINLLALLREYKRTRDGARE